jgi:hypothetical protein
MSASQTDWQAGKQLPRAPGTSSYVEGAAEGVPGTEAAGGASGTP